MPKNKRESLIYTVLMCFTMVLWMSVYNVALQHGELSMAVLRNAWMGFPIAYVFAMICDWFLVSCCMVVPMVLIMSLYGAAEACVHTGQWSMLLLIWVTNIPKNFIMALPFQLIVAGPLVRFVFRRAFPEGSIVAE